eukprot:365042-Chlamydomonas_euryale.AAC.19
MAAWLTRCAHVAVDRLHMCARVAERSMHQLLYDNLLSVLNTTEAHALKSPAQPFHSALPALLEFPHITWTCQP